MERECYIQMCVRDHLLNCLKLDAWKNHPDYEMLKVDYYQKVIKINKFLCKFAR
jgi:hypothetical protein